MFFFWGGRNRESANPWVIFRENSGLGVFVGGNMILAANDKLLAWGVVFFILFLGSPLMKGIVFFFRGYPLQKSQSTWTQRTNLPFVHWTFSPSVEVQRAFSDGWWFYIISALASWYLPPKKGCIFFWNVSKMPRKLGRFFKWRRTSKHTLMVDFMRCIRMDFLIFLNWQLDLPSGV